MSGVSLGSQAELKRVGGLDVPNFYQHTSVGDETESLDEHERHTDEASDPGRPQNLSLSPHTTHTCMWKCAAITSVRFQQDFI